MVGHLQLAQSIGLEVIEQNLSRESLYLADEMFMTGTAAEITPVRSVDRIDLNCRRGDSGRGPVTERIQSLFFGLFTGETEDRWSWLSPIDPTEEIDHAPTAVSV